MSMSPAERRLQTSAAAYASWAKTPDPSIRTAPARDAFAQKFLDQVDPDGTLPPAERARRAEQARRAFYQDLSRKAVRARRLAAEARTAARRHDAEATEVDAALSDLSGDAA